MKLVTLSGLDGSGKSTQISFIRDHLEKRGKSVYYFHAIQFSAASHLTRNNNKQPGSTSAITRSGAFGIFLRTVFLYIDIIRFHLLIRKLQHKKIDFLLSDRYFFDTLVHIAFLKKDDHVSSLPRFLPRPDAAFFLNASPKEILKRDQIPEQGSSYLEHKYSLYCEAAKQWNLTIIDGIGDPKDISSSLLSYIERL